MKQRRQRDRLRPNAEGKRRKAEGKRPNVEGKRKKKQPDPKEEEARKVSRQAQELGLAPINREKLHSSSVFGHFQQSTFHGCFYLDYEFTCKDCGKVEVWTGRQQKWWYEVARGEVEQTAVRCRSCRQKEKRRRDEARRVHLEGLERKKRGK